MSKACSKWFVEVLPGVYVLILHETRRPQRFPSQLCHYNRHEDYIWPLDRYVDIDGRVLMPNPEKSNNYLLNNRGTGCKRNEVPLVQVIRDDQKDSLVKYRSSHDDTSVPLPDMININWIGKPDSVFRCSLPMENYFDQNGNRIIRIKYIGNLENCNKDHKHLNADVINMKIPQNLEKNDSKNLSNNAKNMKKSQHIEKNKDLKTMDRSEPMLKKSKNIEDKYKLEDKENTYLDSKLTPLEALQALIDSVDKDRDINYLKTHNTRTNIIQSKIPKKNNVKKCILTKPKLKTAKNTPLINNVPVVVVNNEPAKLNVNLGSVCQGSGTKLTRDECKDKSDKTPAVTAVKNKVVKVVTLQKVDKLFVRKINDEVYQICPEKKRKTIKKM